MAIHAVLAAWHYIFEDGSGRYGVAHGRRQRDAGGPQGQVGGRARCRSDDEALAVVLISVSVSEPRSAMISGQEPERPSAAMRSSSAFFSTSARKLQNT